MNWLRAWPCNLALGLLALGLTGCRSQLAPVANGYEKVIHPTCPISFEPETPRVSFQFRTASGKAILIWPDIYSGQCVVKDDVAVFLGDKAYVDASGKNTRPRLFAVKAPAVPVDITDEVLWRWSKATGRDFTQTRNRFSEFTVENQSGLLVIHLEFTPGAMLSDERDWPDSGDLKMEWSQVAGILRAESAKGVLQKDLRWHTSYIGINF